MKIVLWVAQGLLAVLFAGAGGMKVVMAKDSLVPLMPWVVDFSSGMVKVIGVLEVLGAVGLVLPALTLIAPVLTPIAATGLAVVMLGGGIVHIGRGEYPHSIGNLVVLALAVLVAWGRFGPYALAARNWG
ncbi:DoxX family protein [Micromonospora sp. NPDC047465]|uniref:DoxX family protein n=1 Tax=Micromonospora sp. NPDC047465 TaxID=3154813 RepID=UPI0033DC0AE7